MTQIRVAGRYQVQAELGRGGMGAVYRCLDVSTGKLVALKQLLPEAKHHARMAELFEREYQVLAGLDDERIIRVEAYGIDDGLPYYTMELLDGQDLRELAPLPYREACRYLRDVASSLALLHARRLLHRDVSPRNVRLTAAGRVKLIDFGALTAFGIAQDIVGTAPYVPPEALRGAALDHRADLYSLGALAYWTLTGRNAYEASQLADLPEAWCREPPAPSERAHDIPPALDELVMALLRMDALARPQSAAEVIERLNVIAELAPEQSMAAGESYLASSFLVGRATERQRLIAALTRAHDGKGTSLVIESAAGLGRTRLLGEATLEAQLRGFTVLHADARVHTGPYGVLRALVRSALHTAPDFAKARLRSRALVLDQAIPEVKPLASSLPPPEVSDPGERRARARTALEAWLLETAEVRPLLIAVDDLQLADQDSLAVLGAVACAARSRTLVLLSTLRTGFPSSDERDALVAQSSAIALAALRQEEVEQLVSSTFGAAANVTPLARWLYGLVGGSPTHCMELLRHLVSSGVVSYAGGTWVLPNDLAQTQLPRGIEDVLCARLAALSTPARALAEAVSVDGGAVSFALCAALASEHSEGEVHRQLDELVRHGILVGTELGYGFASEALQAASAHGLSETDRRALHARLAEILLREDPRDPERKLRAGFHLLNAGEALRGAELLAEAGSELARESAGKHLASAVPALQAALEVFRSHGWALDTCIRVLVPLTLAGHFKDHRLTAQYSAPALKGLLRITGGALAARLTPWLGPRLAVSLAVLWALASYPFRRRSQRSSSFRAGFVALFGVASASATVHTVCNEPEKIRQIEAMLRPFVHMRSTRLGALIHRFIEGLSADAGGTPGASHETSLQLIRQLSRPGEFKDLPEPVRLQLLAGSVYMCGLSEMTCDGRAGFERAQQLEDIGLVFYRLHADLLRMYTHALRGEARQAEEARRRLELHGIRAGYSWYLAAMVPKVMHLAHALTEDMIGLKLEVEQLDRSAARFPSMVVLRELAQARLEFLRGDVRAAVARYETLLSGERHGVPASGIEIACFAEALNALGEHARARQLCLAERESHPEHVRKFAVIFHAIERQLARAEAGLSMLDSAVQRLEALSPRELDNPLLAGLVHRELAQLAMRTGEVEAFRTHFGLMQERFRTAANPALISQAAKLREAARKLNQELMIDDPAVDAAGKTALQAALNGVSEPRERAERALNVLLDHSGAREGFLYLLRGEALELVASRGPEQAGSELLLRAADEMEQFSTVSEATEVVATAAPRGTLSPTSDYGTLVLSARGTGGSRVIGVVALYPSLARQRLEDGFVRALSEALSEAPANDVSAPQHAASSRAGHA